jgi:peptidoglycan/xylan/chitin deacetylase (PgdA/CDA1 family)
LVPTKQLGIRPRGYRSPYWDYSENTLDLIEQFGFEFDNERLRLREPDRGSKKRGNMRTLIGNTIVGLTLLFLTNLSLADDIPIDIITVVICAILGVLGWALVLILHLLGIAF